METPEYWEGFDEAIQLALIEVDKILAKAYTDGRLRDSLLDARNSIKTIRDMATA